MLTKYGSLSMKLLNKVYLLAGIFTAVLTSATPSLSAGSDTSPSPLLSLVRKNYNKDTPMEADLALSIYWSVREKEEKKQGRIALAPGDCFRVTIGSETYVSDGKTLWDYNSRANQVVIKLLADVNLTLHPSSIFTNYIDACPFREQERKNETALLSWKTDSASAPYSSIRVWVRIKTGIITKCEMVDRNKNLFTYTFSGTVIGKKAPGEAFDFVIPKSAQVIDSRK